MKRRTLLWFYETVGMIAAVGSALGSIDSARELARLASSGGTARHCDALVYSCASLLPLLIPVTLWWKAPQGSAWSHLWARAAALPALVWLTARLFLWVGPWLF